jgi:hypothetical protein
MLGIRSATNRTWLIIATSRPLAARVSRASRAAARLRAELNPVEYSWANLKDGELANRSTTTLAEVADATEQGIQRVCKSDSLVVGSSPTPACPCTYEPSTQPTKLNKTSTPRLEENGLAFSCAQ